jgi:hypothetical protein
MRSYDLALTKFGLANETPVKVVADVGPPHGQAQQILAQVCFETEDYK